MSGTYTWVIRKYMVSMHVLDIKVTDINKQNFHENNSDGNFFMSLIKYLSTARMWHTHLPHKDPYRCMGGSL